MTVKELYEFAKKHGFEDASLWVSSGLNAYSSIDSAKIEISSDKVEMKRVYLNYES